jgi:hypothetical protein
MVVDHFLTPCIYYIQNRFNQFNYSLIVQTVRTDTSETTIVYSIVYSIVYRDYKGIVYSVYTIVSYSAL